MVSPEREAERPLDNFLEQYKRDRLQDCVRSLEEYLGMFPGDDEKVSRAYAALSEPAVTLPASGVELAAPDLTSPDRIQFGAYRIIDEIGRGGQGVVYRAMDENLGRVVALKVLGRVVALKVLRSVGRNSDKAVRRFKREAEVAAKLQHAGICAVHDAGVQDGVPYIAMQYVEGESLSTRIAASRQTEHAEFSTQMTQRLDGGDSGSDDRSSSHSSGSAPSDRRDIMSVVELIERAARALHVAHEAGVIHRDIKPGNLMITPDDQPVILDFGMAREIESGEQDLTRSGDLFGTTS